MRVYARGADGWRDVDAVVREDAIRRAHHAVTFPHTESSMSDDRRLFTCYDCGRATPYGSSMGLPARCDACVKVQRECREKRDAEDAARKTVA